MNIMKKKSQKSDDAQHSVYVVTDYHKAGSDFIANNANYFSIAELSDELAHHDKYYHFRVHNKHQYVFFGDLDHFEQDIDIFFDCLIEFLAQYTC